MTTLDTLAEVTARRAALNQRWETLIERARAEGHSARAVGDAAGISHVAILKKEKESPVT